VARVSKLVAVWKAERPRLFAGHTIPIGAAPDGTTWTGLASVAADRRSGYLLLFRELHPEADWTTPLTLFAAGAYRVTPLAGEGSAELTSGRLSVHIPRALQYLWVRIEHQ